MLNTEEENMNRVGEVGAYVIMKVCSIFPIQKKMVFTAYAGRSYAGNPKTIYKEIVKKCGSTYKYIWIMADKGIVIENADVVKKRTLLSLYHIATAKVWVDNSRKSWAFVKRKDQYYVQTWHANIMGKRVEADAEDKLEKSYVKNAKHDSQMADLFLSGSAWLSERYREAFWYDGEILEYGLPRSDIFYKKEADVYKKKVYEYYHLDSGVKLALYAPTFRADGNMDCYGMDYQQLLTDLQEKWNGKWKILVRLHPNIQKRQNAVKYSEDVLNGSEYGDMNELIVASELLITDYSSCMFDAMEAGKKVLLYATDIEAYMADRGTYFAFEELPFLLAEDKADLHNNIKKFEEEIYKKKSAEFIRRCGICNCSNSTEKIADYIIKQIEER